MTDEKIVFPTVNTVDLEAFDRIQEGLLSQIRINLIEQNVQNEAVGWLMKEVIVPVIDGYEIYSCERMGWTNGIEIQVPLNSREQIDEWLQVMASIGFFENDSEVDKEDKERVGKNYATQKREPNYLEYKFKPDKELLAEIKERFDYEFKYVKSYGDNMRTYTFSEYSIDLHIEFYPTSVADCVITDLGKVERTREVQVFEVTCPEGAAEMEAIMNGGDNAESD